MTNQKLNDIKLIPNFTVKKTIESFQERVEDFKKFKEIKKKERDSLGNNQNGPKSVMMEIEVGYYEGEVHGGKAQGIGKITYKTGSVYTGAVANNLPNGFGLLQMVKGDSYEGSFKDGFMDGVGLYIYKNGD